MPDPLRGTIVAALLLTVVSACENKPSSHQAPANSHPPLPATGPAAAAGSAMRAGRAAARQATPSSMAAPDSRFAGRWSGSYIARKAAVTIPPGASDKPWRRDKSKRAVGQGTLYLNIHPDGSVAGTGDGALGPLVLRGAIMKQVLRAGVTVSDVAQAERMTGTLIGRIVGEHIASELRVANGDGTIVRLANPNFKRHTASDSAP